MKKLLFLTIIVLGLLVQGFAQKLGDYTLGQDFSNTDHVGCRRFMPFASGNNIVFVDLDSQTKIIGITYSFESKKTAEAFALKYMSECKFKKNVFFQDKGNIRYGTQKTGLAYTVVAIDMSKKDQISNSVPGQVSIPKLITNRNNSIGGLWELDRFVDEFGDKVGEQYCALPYVNGIFSNSATSGSSMLAKLLITKDRILFRLFEYDNVPVTGNDYITILIKDSEGEKTVVIGKQRGKYIVVTDNSGEFYTSNDYLKFKSLLEKEGEMQFVLKGEYGETYKFTLNVDGYVDIFPSKPWE